MARERESLQVFEPVKKLGLFSAIMIVMGAMIGIGIFSTPSEVTRYVFSPGFNLLVWCFGGGIALLGAFCYAELAGLFPRVGGPYAFLSEGFTPMAGFLYGWTMLTTINTGALAAIAYVFAEYLSFFYRLTPVGVKLWAVGCIVAFSVINYFGIKTGAIAQNTFTMLKVGALIVLISVGLLWGKGGGEVPSVPFLSYNRDYPLLAAWGLALVPVLFTYGGWQHVTFVAGEVKNPRRNLPLAQIVGTMGVVVLYILTNRVFLNTLPVNEIVGNVAVTSRAAEVLMGGIGARFIAAAVIISCLGVVNVLIMAPTRIYYAMSRDGLFFRKIAALHPKYQSPHYAIILQGLWAIILILSRTFGGLLEYVVFGDWIFFGLTAGTLLIFRRRLPGAPRSYRMRGVPVLPLIFIGAAAFVVANTFVMSFVKSLIGAGIISLGIPVYLHWRRK